METFWRLLEESIILQSCLTIGLWGVIIFMTIRGQPIPDILSAGGYTILGFWFGSKATIAATTAAKATAAAVQASRGSGAVPGEPGSGA